MKKDVMVLGGGGYLGSVIVQRLCASREVIGRVEVVDCDLYGDIADMPSSVVHIDANVLDGLDVPTKTETMVVWAIDIDSEDFYILPSSRAYVEKNLEAFGYWAMKLGSRLVLVTDDYFGDNVSYKEFLQEKVRICGVHGCKYVKVPQLYGPSARMRYDTLLNEMFLFGFTNGVIQVDDWLRKYPTCSVGTAGEYIVDEVVIPDSGESPDSSKIRNFLMSLCEYAGVMSKVFDGKVQIVLSNRMAVYEYAEEIVDELPVGRYTVQKSFEYMLNSLEKDGIADMVRSCHNNARMLTDASSYGKLVKAMGKFL